MQRYAICIPGTAHAPHAPQEAEGQYHIRDTTKQLWRCFSVMHPSSECNLHLKI